MAPACVSSRQAGESSNRTPASPARSARLRSAGAPGPSGGWGRLLSGGRVIPHLLSVCVCEPGALGVAGRPSSPSRLKPTSSGSGLSPGSCSVCRFSSLIAFTARPNSRAIWPPRSCARLSLRVRHRLHPKTELAPKPGPLVASPSPLSKRTRKPGPRTSSTRPAPAVFFFLLPLPPRRPSATSPPNEPHRRLADRLHPCLHCLLPTAVDHQLPRLPSITYVSRACRRPRSLTTSTNRR